MSEDIGNEIAKDNFSGLNCPISLYHATSTLFLDSIEQYGLGGLNIIKEWNVLAFVKEIYPYAQKLPDYPKWDFFGDMARQTTKGFNFQHGDVYCSGSKKYAFEFLRINPYGSELVSNALFYFKKIIDNKLISCEKAKSFEEKYSFLEKCRQKSINPIVFKLPSLSYDDLLDEKGKDVSDSMKTRITKILEISKEEIFRDAVDACLGSCRFRLKKIIPYNDLNIVNND
jgi:hypothetical protein